MTEPRWKVDMEAQHGTSVFAVTQIVAARNKADARERAMNAANRELHGMGSVVRIVNVERVAE